MHAAELVALAALTARLSVEHARSRLDEVQTFSQIAELASVSLATVYLAACFAVSPAVRPDSQAVWPQPLYASADNASSNSRELRF